MPMARIDLVRGKSAAHRQAIGEAVHQGLVSIGEPADERFQVIAEHDPANFSFPRAYLGLAHAENLVMIQITLNEGRTTVQKQALFKIIAEGIHAATGVRVEDVVISLVEVTRETWSFGGGAAQHVDG